MSKNDDGFNLDDMMEIFGETASLPAKKDEPVQSAPAVAIATPPADDSVSDDELAILEAYEKSKKDQKAKEEEARRQKDQAAQKILEQYEKELREARERESKLKKELEERQKKELEDLKKKEAFTVNKEEEERKIIEEFERQAREQKEAEDKAKLAQEEKAQQELHALAQKQKADEEARQAEAAKSEAAFKAQAAAQMGDKKESRLMELLAKAQKDLESAAPAPLPSAAASSSAGSGQARGAASGSPKDVLIDVEQKENDAFIFMLDETRKSMFTFLAPMIGIKASTNMLNKTVERARSKAAILLKDANWKMDGTLREDGSVDPERILANVQKLPAASRADDFVSGLHELVDLRIKAVEAGLGAKAGADMRAKLADCRRVFTEKNIKADWVNLFYGQVIG